MASVSDPGTSILQICELVSSLDEHIGTVVESASGETRDFRVGQIIASLLDSGLDFYAALGIVMRIEEQLQPGIETREISRAIIAELDAVDQGWATEFRTKYDEGIVISIGSGEEVPLCMSEIRSFVKSEAEAMGYDWGGRRFLGEVTGSMYLRCRDLGMPKIPSLLLKQLFEQELRERLAGHTLQEHREAMPSVVETSAEEIASLVGRRAGVESYLIPTQRLCEALLFYFGTLPPLEQVECINAAITLLDRARAPSHPLRTALENFGAAKGGDPRDGFWPRARRDPEDYTIAQAKACLRRLSFVASEQRDASPRILQRKPEDITPLLCFLAELAQYLWPEDWLAASTLKQLRHSVLRCLFRCRCLSVVKLTRGLQVHPKHTLRALTPLLREGLVITHQVQDGVLVLITPQGEQYCADTLGLKLRCSLSSL